MYTQIVPQQRLCCLKFKFQIDHYSQRSLRAWCGPSSTFRATAGRMDVKEGAEAIQDFAKDKQMDPSVSNDENFSSY